MAYETVLLEKKDGVAYLTLNRPDRANTISAQLAHDVFIERAAYALKAAKILINSGVELPLTEALKYERKVIAGMATSDERRQAQQAAASSQATYARIFKDRT